MDGKRPNKNPLQDSFSELTWQDLEEWAGGKIVSRGMSYQRQGRVSGLAATADGALVAWVQGTMRYATRVVMDQDGFLDSVCTCPYEWRCKHGVAVVLEYLERVENDRGVPSADRDDPRLQLLEAGDWYEETDDDEEALPEVIRQDIDRFLKGKTKAQLVELIHELAEQHPEIARDLSDRGQLTSGNTQSLVRRLQREIREIGDEPGWCSYRDDDGFIPDYSGIRSKLEMLLEAGQTDAVLTLGRELVSTGTRQVEESQDDGETAVEVAECMPVIVEALARSSLDHADRLDFALDAVLEDEFEVTEAFAEYLHRKHPKVAWHTLSDRLLARLKDLEGSEEEDEFSRNYVRDRLSDWTIHALERAGRRGEIIPLCIAETERTHSYQRLVDRLVAEKRDEEAEHWIREGIRETKHRWPGIAGSLRDSLRGIRRRQNNWPSLAAIEAEAFVRRPSRTTFAACKKACSRVKVWPKVRTHLLCYLEKGELPWEQGDWPLPETGLDKPRKRPKTEFPMLVELIGIAVLEKRPDQVLCWYDQLPQDRFGRSGVNDDEIATAIQAHAPDRAVAIWQRKAENLIAQVKPVAYQEAAKYLGKARKVMSGQKRDPEWDQYLEDLRSRNARKTRLMEILDGLDRRPIVKRSR